MLEDLGFTSGAPASSNNSDPAPASAPGLVKRSKGEERMAQDVQYSPAEIASGMPQRDAEYEALPAHREDLLREINRARRETDKTAPDRVATLEGDFSNRYGEAPPGAGLMRVSTAARAAQPPKVNSKAPKPIEATGESRIEDVGFAPYGDQPKAAAQSASENGEFAKGAMNALVGGNPRMLGRSMEVFGLLTDSPSVEEKGSALVTKSDEWSEKYKGRVPSAENIGDNSTGISGLAGDAWDYLKFQAGNALGSMAPSLVAGAAVGVATKSPRVGFVAGAAIPAYVQNLGDVYDSVATDPDIKARIDNGEMTKKQLAGIAAAVAIPVAALDMWSLDKGVGAFFKEQKGVLYSRIAKAIATGAITEGSTEGLQQVIQEWAQVSLGSEKSLKSSMFAILDSVIGGMAGGSLIRGGATAVAGVVRPQSDAPPINKPGDASPISVEDVPGVGGAAAAPAAPAAAATPASGPAINLEGVGAQARDALFNLDQGDTPLDRYNRLGRDLEKLDPDSADHVQLTAERNDIATSFPTTTLGDPAILSMPSGAQLESRYGLIEADDAISSHRGDMTPEPDFPATWQERNRGAAASQVQIATIKARPDYNLLGQSPSPQEGAPTLAVNGVSLAGRGRLIAEKAIYDEGGEKAEIQRQKMIAMAIDAGVPESDAQQFKNPIFSRFLTTPVNPVEFARQADQKSGMVMSPIELARSDANRMGSIDGLQITDGGDFMVPANRAIIKGFFAGLPQSEQAGLVDATGDISQAGYRRFMNAMLVKAYGGNSGTAMRIIETLNPDLKRLTGALVRVAPLIAKARDAVRDSKLAALDISQDLLAAVDQLVQLRDDKMSVTDFLAQSEMFERVNEDTLSILMFLEQNLNSPNRIVQFVEAYLAELELVGNVDQNEMFGAAPVPTRAELLKKSKGDLNDEAAKLATAISAKQGTSDETVAAEPGAVVEAAPAEIPVSVEAGASSEQQPDNGLFGAEGAGESVERSDSEAVAPAPEQAAAPAAMVEIKAEAKKLAEKKKPAAKAKAAPKPKAKPSVAKKPIAAAVEQSNGFGDANTVFTKSRADAARALLKKKSGQLNVGLDPEMMQAGIELAGYYIEGGARSFADYSAKMLADLGDEFKPYFKAFYSAVRNWPGFDNQGMQSEVEVEAAILSEAAGSKPTDLKKRLGELSANQIDALYRGMKLAGANRGISDLIDTLLEEDNAEVLRGIEALSVQAPKVENKTSSKKAGKPKKLLMESAPPGGWTDADKVPKAATIDTEKMSVAIVRGKTHFATEWMEKNKKSDGRVLMRVINDLGAVDYPGRVASLVLRVAEKVGKDERISQPAALGKKPKPAEKIAHEAQTIKYEALAKWKTSQYDKFSKLERDLTVEALTAKKIKSDAVVRLEGELSDGRTGEISDGVVGTISFGERTVEIHSGGGVLFVGHEDVPRITKAPKGAEHGHFGIGRNKLASWSSDDVEFAASVAETLELPEVQKDIAAMRQESNGDKEAVANRPGFDEGYAAGWIAAEYGLTADEFDESAATAIPEKYKVGFTDGHTAYAAHFDAPHDPNEDLTFGLKFPDGYTIERNKGGDVVFSGTPDGETIGIVAVGAHYTKETAEAWSKIANTPAQKAPSIAAEAKKLAAPTIDAAAHEAATSPMNDLFATEPQIQAGNYQKGHYRISGLDISIENPEGSERNGIDPNGKPWSVTMLHHYGYIRGTVGRDKDHLDVFVKPGTRDDWRGDVFIVDQKKLGNGHFDEHKIMLGWDSLDAARDAYISNYDSSGAERIMDITPLTFDHFKEWLATGDTKERAAKDASIITRGAQNADSSGSLEPDSGSGASQERVGEETVSDGSRRADETAPDAGSVVGKAGVSDSGDSVVSDGGAVAGGERGDQSIHRADGQFGLTLSSTGVDDGERGSSVSNERSPVESVDASAVERAAEQAVSLKQKLAAQRAAQDVPVIHGDIANIRDSLPILLPGQQDDVKFAEDRFAKPAGTGVLFTNGTGTGKTYTGLGIIKRFERAGKTNILVLAPTDKVISDWVSSGRNLGLTLTPLDGIDDSGRGITITTYANFANNRTMADRNWDLVVGDESHYFLSNAEGFNQPTQALINLRAITNNHRGGFRRAQMILRDIQDKIDAVKAAEIEDNKSKSLDERDPKFGIELTKLAQEFEEKAKPIRDVVNSIKPAARTRVAFLSATPFPYVKTIDYAEGYLFNYTEGEARNDSAYNSGNDLEHFYMQHFGYRMRYNKLTQPEADVDSSLMERQFNSTLKKQGVLSGRMLEVDVDYDRKFILVESGIGRSIDEGLNWLREKERNTPEGKEKFEWRALNEAVNKRFNYLSRLFLLEALKAREVVPHIKANLALGRKVVVFHDYKKGGAFHPFRLPMGMTVTIGNAYVNLDEMVKRFESERPDLQALDFDGLSSPIVTLTKAFPNIMVFNGDVPKKERRRIIEDFQNDHSGKDLVLLQSASGKEGISAHDTTGKFQRIEFNLGMPTAPTTAIQQEGRILRTGSVTDAMFRYLNTGTDWERAAFAHTIAGRAATAENLALGESARGLRDSFIDAFENSDFYPAGHDGEGKGGKVADKAAMSAISPFDRAKTMYFANAKKTARNKAAEGKDYFATPEPLGLKMVEWSGVRDGEKMLEPSAGHGAIARFFPEHTIRTAIEPSTALNSRLALVTNANIIPSDFESHHIVNKYDAIVMNPPFGSGGKTAIEHLDKAAGHLHDGGRIVALIPNGPAADKRFEKWLYDDQAVKDGLSHAGGMFLVANIQLPAVTFERAGTNVSARIVVLEKQTNPDLAAKLQQVNRDYSGANTIKEFFNEIEDASIEPRVSAPKADPLSSAPAAALLSGRGGKLPNASAPVAAKVGDVRLAEFKHSKTGATMYAATPQDRVERDEYDRLKAIAKKFGGWYSSFRGSGAVAGFLFKTAEARAEFVKAITPAAFKRLDRTGSMPVSAVRQIVANVRRALPGAAQADVLGSTSEAPAGLREQIKAVDGEATVQGAWWRGKVYIFADNIGSYEDAEYAILHEYGHDGLRKFFGAELDAVLTDIWSGSMAVQLEVAKLRKEFPDLSIAKATEEHLANVAASGEQPSYLQKLVAFIRSWLREHGFVSEFSDNDILSIVAAARGALTGKPQPFTPALRDRAMAGMSMFKRTGQADELTPAQRADAILSEKRGTIAPLDATFKALSNASGFTKLTTKAYGLFERLGSFVPEKAKAGLISDYGIPEAVIDLREAMFGKIRQGIRGVQHQLERLMGLTRAESSVAYEWMNGRDAEGLISRLPEDSQATLRELRDWIDTMGREAVRLGQLTAAAYEKNRFAYLHRSYLKYETDQGKQASANRGRAISVLGDQYKGRGMVDAVPMSKIRNAVGIEFWNRMLKDGQADKGLVGEKFIRFERRANRGESVGVLEGVQKTEQHGKLLEVAYWPENLTLPSHLAGWERSADLWEARNTKGDKVLMWRDFTAAERRSMGEIDEVRYSVAKTMQQMIHDVEVGRYLEKLANTFAKPEAPRGAEIVEASERMVDSFKPGTWVEVPTSKIVGTQALKYGKLAGLWIEGPVWNDIRQTVNQRYQPFGEAYATVLKAWKIAKAPLSPAVHMNNIAANVVMADWHDVRAAHLLAAMKVMVGQDDPANVHVMERFEDAGGSSGTFAISEIQRTQLKPLLDALEEQIKSTDEGRSILNASAVLQALGSWEWRQALAAADASKGWAVIKAGAGKVVDLYQIEDVAFRLAAFMKAKSEGVADLAAGKVARKSFLDYSINAPWIQMMRSTAFPFLAFTYRAVPMLLDIAAHKPWKLLKMATVLGALNAIGYAIGGGDEDKDRKLLPEEKAGKIFGFMGPKLIRMPWNDDHDSPVFLDIRRFIPVGDVFDLGQTHSALPVPPAALPGGPLVVLAELIFNKSQFTGKGITQETDTPLEMAGAVLNHLYKAFTPNVLGLPGTYATSGVYDAIDGKTDAFGRERSVAQALLSSVGVKVGAYPHDTGLLNARIEYQHQVGEIDKNIAGLRRQFATKAIDQAQFNAKLMAQVDKKMALAVKLRERVAP